MKLQQLHYLSAVVRSELNVSSAARQLHTSQPALSKQIRLLEEELGARIFARSGRQLTGITPLGQQIFSRVQSILRETRYIETLAQELRGEGSSSLSIGTTHTQARYVLPQIIRTFSNLYPKMKLHLHQGTAEQISSMVKSERIDLAIATGSRELFPDWVLLPWYHWYRCIVVPHQHPLAALRQPSLADLANYPLITYAFSLAGPDALQTIFAGSGLQPRIALTAWDADIIKTYVRCGLGVGIVAEMALDVGPNADLARLDARHLLPRHTTWIGFSRSGLLRGCMYDFMQLCAAHLDREAVLSAQKCSGPAEIDAMFASLPLPQYAAGKIAPAPSHSI